MRVIVYIVILTIAVMNYSFHRYGHIIKWYESEMANTKRIFSFYIMFVVYNDV